jgi:DNA-directed RNA polymerase subunit RPC12/RpoP
MDRQDFYAIVKQYEAYATRQGNWAVTGLFVAIFLPMLVVLAFPLESRPSTMVSTAVVVTILILYGYLLRILNRRAAVKFGMICGQCQNALDLRHIGFTAKCSKCGSRVFVESNPLSQPTAQKPAAAE